MYIPGVDFVVVHLGGNLIATLWITLRDQSPSSVVKKTDDLLAQAKTEKTRIESLKLLSSRELTRIDMHIAE